MTRHKDQFDFAARQLDLAHLEPQRWSQARTEDIGHDRFELREILVCHDLTWMDPSVRDLWGNLNCVIMVRRQTHLGAGKTRVQTRNARQQRQRLPRTTTLPSVGILQLHGTLRRIQKVNHIPVT